VIIRADVATVGTIRNTAGTADPWVRDPSRVAWSAPPVARSLRPWGRV